MTNPFGSTCCVLIAGLLTAACSPVLQHHPSPLQNDLSYLAKTDIDTVADIHYRSAMGQLRVLTEKLYRRNPRHCKAAGRTLTECIARVMRPDSGETYSELRGRRGTEAIGLAFDEAYPGDRVLAFTVGLKTMLASAYDDKTEFFVYDELDPQRLYNSARNIEIAVWQMGSRRDQNGELLLLSDTIDEQTRNLSYERLFGKLIALQDTMARIVAESTDRRIKNVIQQLATAVFLPI